MTRQLTISTFILITCLTGCRQIKTETKKEDQTPSFYKIDTLVITILPFNTKYDWIFKDGKSADLTTDDLLKIENILKKCINNYNIDQEKQFERISQERCQHKLDKMYFVIDLTRYKRQYVAIINAKGEKEVWVNCFCETWDRNWKTNLILVKDGGNCYFNLKINLTTGNYNKLMVNGDT